MSRKNPVLYYGGKLLSFLLSVLFLSLAVFYASRLAPGDPLVSYYGERAEKMTVQERAQAEERLGLRQPTSSTPAGCRTPWRGTSASPISTRRTRCPSSPPACPTPCSWGEPASF